MRCWLPLQSSHAPPATSLLCVHIFADGATTRLQISNCSDFLGLGLFIHLCILLFHPQPIMIVFSSFKSYSILVYPSLAT